MYRNRRGQQSFLGDAQSFVGAKLDLENEWVKLGSIIPWSALEDEYVASLSAASVGSPAKPARMALGTLVIKKRYRFSDLDTLNEVQMNPYLQHFIGMTEFSHHAPFDASSITRFRQRVSPELMKKLDGYAKMAKQLRSAKWEAKSHQAAGRRAPKRGGKDDDGDAGDINSRDGEYAEDGGGQQQLF